MGGLCVLCKDLANHIITLANDERDDEVLNCMSYILDIYTSNYNTIVNTAIENIFIYNVGSQLLLQGKEDYLESILPESFSKILRMQLIGSNI